MSGNEKLAAIMNMMDRMFPGTYKTGEIFPGDTAPAVIQTDGKIRAVPAAFGFPGFDGQRRRLLRQGLRQTGLGHEKARRGHGDPPVREKNILPMAPVVL